jgi:hypothetical protein
VFALFFLILVIPSQDKDAPDTAIVDTTPVKTEEKPKEESAEFTHKQENNTVVNKLVKTFEFTPETFAKRMNANLKVAESSFRLKIRVESGEVNDIFNYSFNENLAILGTIDKVSKNLSTITLITRGDGTAKSGVDVMAIVISAYSAVFGDNTMKTGEPAKVVMKLIEMSKNSTKEKPTVSTIFNGIKFSFMSSDTVGNWFIAEPI